MIGTGIRSSCRIREADDWQRDPPGRMSSCSRWIREGENMENELTQYLEDIYQEVSPVNFYRGIFPSGELDKDKRITGKITPFKYTGIIIEITGEKNEKGRNRIKKHILTDDLEAVNRAAKTDSFCMCSPLSYAGKNRTKENARMLYAIAIDLDKIRMEHNKKYGIPTGICDLFHQFDINFLPRPTYTVSSGTGLHLYYLLDRPIPLYKQYAFELQELKNALTRKVWNQYIVNIKDKSEIQQEGIYQAFRMPGTITKRGERTRAFLTGERVTLEYLNGFVEDLSKAKQSAKHKKGKLTLAEAKRLYPDWYDRRIEKKQPRGRWPINRRLYDWWKRKITVEAQEGHRYYCLMMLVIYAQKCGVYHPVRNPNPVTREELQDDCFELLETMEALTTREDNHFTEEDVFAALEAYDNKWITYPRKSIEYKSGITMNPTILHREKGKRLKQAEHLEEARAIRDIRAQRNGVLWDENNGRKSKFEVVYNWRQMNPGKGIIDCISETGLSRATVYRHWKAAEAPFAEDPEKAKNRTRKPKTDAEIAIGQIKALIERVKTSEEEYIYISDEEEKTLKAAAELLEKLESSKEPGAAAVGSSAGDPLQMDPDADDRNRDPEQLQDPGGG